MKGKAMVFLLAASFALPGLSAQGGAADSELSFLGLCAESIINPVGAFSALEGSPDAGAMGWGITIGYGVMYAQTALLLGLRGIKPFYPHPLNPTPDDIFYLVQAGHTVPSSAIFMGAGFGACYLVSILFGANPDPAALWAGFSAGLIMPTFATMWLPETAAALFAGGGTNRLWPEWIDAARQIGGALWSAILTGIAVSQIGGLEWWQGAIAGFVGTGVTGMLFGMFYR